MLLLGLIVLVCLTVSLQVPLFEDENEEESRVFRGQYAKPGQFPWMVHLQISKGGGYASVCGGSIASRSYVVTAAHCVCTNADKKIYANVKNIIGRIGHINKTEATEVKFSQLFVHEGYDSNYIADIAILKFETSVANFDNNIKPICLADEGKKIPNRQPVVQMGWGRFDNGSVITSPTLKTTLLGYILDNPSCLKEMQMDGDSGQICVSNARGDKICGGDSGGPLCIISGTEIFTVGVVSYDYFDWCVEGNDLPAFYTDVRYYAKWIKKITNNDKEICWKK